jgi:hypothetical protein
MAGFALSTYGRIWGVHRGASRFHPIYAPIHKLIAEVQHLLKPRSVYRDPDLVQRVLAVMNEG